MKRSILIGIVFVGILVVVMLCLVDVIPPRALTLTRMLGAQVRILEYARTHGQLPSDLSVVPLREGYEDRIMDAWGRKLIYEVDASGTVTLKSLGKDGVVGGAGDDTDIVRKFMSHRADGSWSEAADGWSYQSTK